MNNKVLLVLGASSDVGIKIIEKLHNNYELIYAHYNSHLNALKSLNEGIGNKMILIQDDFSSQSAGEKVISVIQEKGVWPDHVIHLPSPNAENVRFTKVQWDSFERNINVTLKSACAVLQPIIKKLVKDRRTGKVIFMLTAYTQDITPKFMTPYITAKYAMLGLMKALAAEYAGRNIAINGISPGMMETKFLDNIFDHVIEENAQKSPFGRNLLIDEVVPAVEFLLSDGADRITGQNIVITGGA